MYKHYIVEYVCTKWYIDKFISYFCIMQKYDMDLSLNVCQLKIGNLRWSTSINMICTKALNADETEVEKSIVKHFTIWNHQNKHKWHFCCVYFIISNNDALALFASQELYIE